MVKDIDFPELDPGRFERLLDPAQYRRFVHRLEEAAERLAGRRVWHVNSTEEGGGVAEMLHFLLGTRPEPVSRSAGWCWRGPGTSSR